MLRLSEEYRVWFDSETERQFGPLLQLDWDGSQLQNVLDRCPALDDSGNWESLMTHVDPDVRVLATRRNQMALRRRFEANDTRAVGWTTQIAELVARENAGRFRYHEMCRPGVALEIRDTNGLTRYVVIGHGDGPEVADDDIVLRIMDLMPIVEAAVTDAA